MSPRRRAPWMYSQSEGFKPIKQVGVAASIGTPIMVVGVLMLFIAYSAGTPMLWWLGGGLALGGALAAASSKII